MTLQSSGAISLGNIQTEFGGSNPISLSEYYNAASGIPASGAISIGQFYGKSSFIPDYTPNAVDWGNMDFHNTASGEGGAITGYSYGGVSNTQTISGINTPITIQIELSSVNFGSGSDFGSWAFVVTKNGFDVALESGSSPLTSATINLPTFSVSNGDNIYFSIDCTVGNDGTFPYHSSSAGINANVNVKNVSNSNNIIDNFTISCSAGILN